ASFPDAGEWQAVNPPGLSARPWPSVAQHGGEPPKDAKKPPHPWQHRSKPAMAGSITGYAPHNLVLLWLWPARHSGPRTWYGSVCQTGFVRTWSRLGPYLHRL